MPSRRQHLYVNVKDKFSLSSLQAWLVDLQLSINVEGKQLLMWIKGRVRQRAAILMGEH